MIKEKKTGKFREIPFNDELHENLVQIYKKLGNPKLNQPIILLTIRGVNCRKFVKKDCNVYCRVRIKTQKRDEEHPLTY